MISHIYVIPKGQDIRREVYLKSWAELGSLKKVKDVCLIDSYIIDYKLSSDALLKVA